MEKLLYLVPVCGLVALLFALFTARYIGKKDAGHGKDERDCRRHCHRRSRLLFA